MCLIDYEIMPLVLFERAEAYTDGFIGSEADVEHALLHLLLQYLVSHFHTRIELHYPEEWSPLGELLHPVGDAGLRSDNQMRTSDLLILVQVAQNGDRLYGFAQTLYRLSWLRLLPYHRLIYRLIRAH